MNELLQIIGSIASIASIPLAVFIYLRQKEAQYRRLRQDIAKTLSYKIGEDSNISLFEVYAVIEARARDAGVNPNLIPPDGVIEDLVAETISNPMLDSERKRRVVENLQSIHTAGVCLRILNAYSAPLSQSLAKATARIEIKPDERAELQSKESDDFRRRAAKPSQAFEALSTTFGIIAAFISTLMFFVGTSSLKGIASWFHDNTPLLGLVAGVLSSLIAGLFTGLLSGWRAKARQKLREEQQKRQQGNCQQPHA